MFRIQKANIFSAISSGATEIGAQGRLTEHFNPRTRSKFTKKFKRGKYKIVRINRQSNCRKSSNEKINHRVSVRLQPVRRCHTTKRKRDIKSCGPNRQLKKGNPILKKTNNA